MGAGANPRCLQAKAGLHPGQVPAHRRGTWKDKQPFALGDFYSFQLAHNACLWAWGLNLQPSGGEATLLLYLPTYFSLCLSLHLSNAAPCCPIN